MGLIGLLHVVMDVADDSDFRLVSEVHCVHHHVRSTPLLLLVCTIFTIS